jgi:hypothetical protein
MAAATSILPRLRGGGPPKAVEGARFPHFVESH